MSKSPILAIDEIAPNQANKYITHNDAIAALEAAMNDALLKDAIGAGPVTLTETEATRYHVYRLSGASADFELVMPSTINGNNAKRVISVRNETNYNATLKASTGAGSTVVLVPGQASLVFQGYEDLYLLSSTPKSSTAPYDVGFYVPGMPEDGAEVMKFVAPREFTLADDFAGSYGHCQTLPLATAVFTVNHNGVAVGTVSVSDAGVFTFSTTGGAVNMVPGDRLSVVAPTPQDTQMADVTIVFAGSRVI